MNEPYSDEEKKVIRSALSTYWLEPGVAGTVRAGIAWRLWARLTRELDEPLVGVRNPAAERKHIGGRCWWNANAGYWVCPPDCPRGIWRSSTYDEDPDSPITPDPVLRGVGPWRNPLDKFAP